MNSEFVLYSSKKRDKTLAIARIEPRFPERPKCSPVTALVLWYLFLSATVVPLSMCVELIG